MNVFTDGSITHGTRSMHVRDVLTMIRFSTSMLGAVACVRAAIGCSLLDAKMVVCLVQNTKAEIEKPGVQ